VREMVGKERKAVEQEARKYVESELASDRGLLKEEMEKMGAERKKEVMEVVESEVVLVRDRLGVVEGKMADVSNKTVVVEERQNGLETSMADAYKDMDWRIKELCEIIELQTGTTTAAVNTEQQQQQGEGGASSSSSLGGLLEAISEVQKGLRESKREIQVVRGEVEAIQAEEKREEVVGRSVESGNKVAELEAQLVQMRQIMDKEREQHAADAEKQRAEMKQQVERACASLASSSSSGRESSTASPLMNIMVVVLFAIVLKLMFFSK